MNTTTEISNRIYHKINLGLTYSMGGRYNDLCYIFDQIFNRTSADSQEAIYENLEFPIAMCTRNSLTLICITGKNFHYAY
jgi:hypothetical protein